MTPKLFIFDCDGVLVDSEPATDRTMAANLSRYGLDLSPHQVGQLFLGGTIKGAGDVARSMGADLPDTWVDEMYAEMFETLRGGVDVFPGVFDLLDQLEAAGIATAIASNGPMAKMDITLKPVGLWDRFEGRIYSGHDYGPKPKPDMILRIMADAGVSVAEAAMIDDSAAGCLAAQNAGIRCFGYVETGDPARLDGTGAEIVTEMAQVPALIGLDQPG